MQSSRPSSYPRHGWDRTAFGSPPVGHGRTMIASPVRVRPLIKRGGNSSDLGFLSGVAIEVGGHGQRAREEKSKVDGRQFALPGPATRFYVEKMIEEALMARCVGLRSLGTLPQKSQFFSSNLGRELPTTTPRSTMTGMLAKAIPIAAMLAGAVACVLSRTRPLSGLLQ